MHRYFALCVAFMARPVGNSPSTGHQEAALSNQEASLAVSREGMRQQSGSAMLPPEHSAQPRTAVTELSLATAQDTVDTSSLVSARFWFEHSPWRLTAIWAALSATLATGLPGHLTSADWPTLTILLLLVDPLWGSIWGTMVGRNRVVTGAEGNASTQMWMPYLRSGSPAARLFGVDGPGILPVLVRTAVPSILLASAVSLALGMAALWMTLAVAGLSLIGWLHRHIDLIPVNLLHSIVAVALPWAITLNYLGITSNHPQWNMHMALVLLWTLMAWGSMRTQNTGNDRMGLAILAGAQLGISVLLILNRSPLWLAIVSVLWLPTWLAAYQARPQSKVRFWLLLAMLISGIGLGQSA